MAAKLDLVKTFKSYYTAKGIPVTLRFGKIPYLSITGKGEPAGEQFTKAVEALYPLAYGVKKVCKLTGHDFGVAKLEGLWWVTSKKPALEVPRSEWHWKLLIRMPEFVTFESVQEAKADVIKKKALDLVTEIKLEIINEQMVVQIMHIGPYSTEHKTLAKLNAFMDEKKFTVNGLHHEIYISDPRKTAPGKMKTILRQPVE